jgi:RNA polymerase sigma factor (TIGR02999 family)
MVCSLIHAAEQGDTFAAELAVAEIYCDLDRIAKEKFERARTAGGLDIRDLLEAAYHDMVQHDCVDFTHRDRFISYAARALRGMIVDHACGNQDRKVNGLIGIASDHTQLTGRPPDRHDLARISHALDELGNLDPKLVEVVDLKFFCGFSFSEIAALCGVTELVVQRRWDKARVYLHRSLGPHGQ